MRLQNDKPICMKFTLLANAEVGEDVVEDGVAGDLAASDSAEGTDGKEK